jgi:ribonuclease J
MKEHKDLIQKVRDKLKSIVRERPNSGEGYDDYIKNKVRHEIGQFLFKETKRRPMVLPVVIKV